ncbi:MAG: transcriptional repressor [Magnetospirillum sp.]|nr:transcriptional repressor [Magnetospirillum sp.]
MLVRHQATEQQMLREAGIRPTTPRMTILRAILDGGHRHLTPESFHQELADAGHGLSLATVYNTLNHFAESDLLRRVGCGDRHFFCTNTREHHHFYDARTGRIEDIPDPQPMIVNLPAPPEGMMIEAVEVIVRLRRMPHN